MAELRTKATGGDVAVFIDTVEPLQRREDARTLCALMGRISGELPAMWGPSIIGFGRYHYRYESGHEGDMARIGFSPRKASLVLYISQGFPRYEALMAKLGKYTTGKSCLYIKKLADVDMAVLEELVSASWAEMAERYP